MSRSRINLFNIVVDSVSLDEVVGKIGDWVKSPQPSGGCRYVVTPNLDHVVQLQSSERLQAAYAEAALVLADGWPLVVASRMFRKPLPERVAGSDLVPALLAAAEGLGGYKLFLLGGKPGVAEKAAANIQKKYPGVEVVGTHSPPWGFEQDLHENQQIIDLVSRSRPDILVVGLGAPKQEFWLHQYYGELDAKVALAAGATIDFLAGAQIRAPRWMQRVHLEWLFRLLQDPRRLTGRYLRDALALPGLLWREWRSGPKELPAAPDHVSSVSDSGSLPESKL